MSVELIETIESKAEAEMAPVLARAASFVVSDEPSYLAADEIASEIRRRVKLLEPELAPVKENATRAWKAAAALWRRFIDDPLEAVKTLDRKRYAWKKAEDKRRQDEAETLRREQARKDAEEKLALATRLEVAGMKEQAAAILDAPVAPTTVVAPAPVVKPAGQAIVENWQARVVDAALIPREYLAPDMVAINKYAKLMKSRAKIPGVEFFDVGTVRRS